MLSPEGEECLTINGGRPLLWSEEMVQEKLMEGLNCFAVLVSLVRACKIDDLRGLALLLFNLTFTHSDLHVGLGQGLHGRGGGS